MRTLRIVIADDEEATRGLLCEIVTHTAATKTSDIHPFESASLAWEYIREHGADIVITDVNMPGISGIELLERVKTANRKTVVIVMSANDHAEEVEQKNGDGFLSKPFRIDQLLTLLEEKAS